MGYIPALFVLFSGGFLWGIVVYNSLKGRQDNLVKKLHDLKKLIIERNASIQAILSEAIPSDLGEFDDAPFVVIQSIKYDLDSNFVEQESKARIWLKSFIQKLREHNYNQESIAYLIRTISEADKAIIDFTKSGKQFNSLIEAKPTSFMAVLLGFKKKPL